MAVGVRGAGGLLDEKTVFVPDAMLPGPRPEFAHRRVIPAKAALRIDWDGVRAAGFGMNFQAVFMRAVAEKAVMIVNSKIADGFAVVGEETVAGVPAVDGFSPARTGSQGSMSEAAAFLTALRASRGSSWLARSPNCRCAGISRWDLRAGRRRRLVVRRWRPSND